MIERESYFNQSISNFKSVFKIFISSIDRLVVLCIACVDIRQMILQIFNFR